MRGPRSRYLAFASRPAGVLIRVGAIFPPALHSDLFHPVSPDDSIHVVMAFSGRQETVHRADSEMRRRFREFDWSGTPIGRPECWPLTWRNAVRLIFNSSSPLALGLGKDLIYLYNDAFIPLGGPDRHPSAVGQPVRLVWQEIWPGILLPRFSHTLDTGEPTGEKDLLLPLLRSGYLEETYISFSFAALPDDQDKPSGIFCAATENTGHVIARRQIDCLRRLAAYSAAADSPESACRAAVKTLDEQSRDVPCGLIYLLDSDGSQAMLAGSFGFGLLPSTVSPSARLRLEADPLGLAAVATRRTPVLIDNMEKLLGPWIQPERLIPRQALAMPVASPASRELAGIFVAGLNPMRPVPESREFLALIAVQLEAALLNARARQSAEERARKLAEIDRAKTAFFSNISHELRTPLTLVLGPIDEVLGSGAIGTGERELLMTARRGSNRLLKLVNSLLEFSRLEAGRVEATYLPVNLATFTAELTSEFRSAFEQSGVALHVECPPLSEVVYVDPDMWEKIVLNLLSNAFKFTLRGAVTVRLYHQDQYARLEVSDTGCGILEGDVPHIFERFYRGQPGEARSVEGTGIGLSLVQELVRLHFGTVVAESRPGQGSTIAVSIPLGKKHLPKERVSAARTATSLRTGAGPFVDEALGWLCSASETLAIENHDTPVTSPDPSSACPKEPERILVVDDNRDMRGYLSRLLEHQWQVNTAPDGRAALSKLREQHYDLLIVDIMMPVMNGLDLLQSMRAYPVLRHTPIILLSARAGEEASVQGLQAGAHDYLAKPFSRRELLARVQNRLTQRKLHAVELLARRRAEEAIQAHENLYSVLAHDLRSPLHAAYMSLSLLQRDIKLSQRRPIAALERSLDNLHQQLDVILEQVKAISKNNSP